MKSHQQALALIAPSGKRRKSRQPKAPIKLVTVRSGFNAVAELYFVEYPEHIINPTNGSHGHWAPKSRRAKRQRRMAEHMARAFLQSMLPCTVTLTRIAPRELDDDNLRAAFKAVRDGVADWLDVNDRDPRVRFEYAQKRDKPNTYGARIEIRRAPA